MVNSLDQIPYDEMLKWGQTARFLIITKKKLGLGLRRQKKKLKKELSNDWADFQREEVFHME